MDSEQIDDLQRQHIKAGEMLADYASLAERHGCPPGMSVYAFIAGRMGRLKRIEEERRSAALDELGKMDDGER